MDYCGKPCRARLHIVSALPAPDMPLFRRSPDRSCGNCFPWRFPAPRNAWLALTQIASNHARSAAGMPSHPHLQMRRAVTRLYRL